MPQVFLKPGETYVSANPNTEVFQQTNQGTLFLGSGQGAYGGASVAPSSSNLLDYNISAFPENDGSSGVVSNTVGPGFGQPMGGVVLTAPAPSVIPDKSYGGQALSAAATTKPSLFGLGMQTLNLGGTTTREEQLAAGGAGSGRQLPSTGDGSGKNLIFTGNPVTGKYNVYNESGIRIGETTYDGMKTFGSGRFFNEKDQGVAYYAGERVASPSVPIGTTTSAPTTTPTDRPINAVAQTQGLLQQEKQISGGTSTGPVEKINNTVVDKLAEQLRAQYDVINQNAGYEYGGKKSDLDNMFRGQAAKLAVNGINDLADVGESNGTLINKVTGDPIKKVNLKGESWKNDGSTAFEFKEDIKLEDRGSFQRWGKDLSVDGQADYGINFVDGQAVMVPIWKDTKTDVGPLAIIASIGLNLAFPGAGAAVGAALAPTASAAVQAAIGSAALAGVSTGVITGDLDKALMAAALAGGGSYLNASGTLGEAFDSLGLTEFKDTFGISGGVQTTAQAAAEDALQLASQGLSEGQISDILQQQYGLDATQALNIGKNAFDVAFAAQDAESLFNITNDANAVAQNLVATGVDPNLANALATSVGMAGANADLSSIIKDSNLSSLVASNSSEGLFTATEEDLAKYGITTAGDGITLTADQLTKIASGEVAGDTFAEQVINAGGAVGGGAAAGGLLDGVTDSAKKVISGLTDGGGFDLGGLLTNLAGAGIDYAALQQIGKEATALGREAEARAIAAGEAANVPFTPYTVTSGAGSTAFGTGPGGAPTATVTASPEYEALRQQALSQAGTALGAINPANAAQSLFNRAEALAGPARQRESEQLLSSLGARGLLGVSRNLPTVGGTTAGVNPYLESLLSAQRTAQAQTALQAQQFGTQEAVRQAALAQGLIGTGQGIDTAAMGTLTQGRQLGADVLGAEQTNAQRLLDATLKGQGVRLGYENIGLDARRQGILGAAGVGRGLLGLPTQPGNTASQNILGNIFTEIFK